MGVCENMQRTQTNTHSITRTDKTESTTCASYYRPFCVYRTTHFSQGGSFSTTSYGRHVSGELTSVSVNSCKNWVRPGYITSSSCSRSLWAAVSGSDGNVGS